MKPAHVLIYFFVPYVIILNYMLKWICAPSF